MYCILYAIWAPFDVPGRDKENKTEKPAPACPCPGLSASVSLASATSQGTAAAARYAVRVARELGEAHSAQVQKSWNLSSFSIASKRGTLRPIHARCKLRAGLRA